jgi:LysR family transcriptional regulator of gallate degradation
LRNRQIALDELRALKSGEHGHARIGLAPAFSGYLPNVIRDLRQRKPGVSFEVVEGTYDALVQRTLKGEIEGAFTMLPPGESVELLAVKRLPDEQIVVVADPGHPLFNVTQPDPADLETESWIVMNRPRSIVDGFYQLAAEQGLASPHVAIETSSLDFLKSTIKNSRLLTLLPRGAVHSELRDGSMKAVKLSKLPLVQTAFVHRHGVMSPLVTEIVHEIESSLKSISDALSP